MSRFWKRVTAERFLMWGAGLTFYAVALTIFAILFNEAWAKEWDVLAFMGSVTGGILTLFGVIITIKNQNKKETVTGFPMKILIIDKFIDQINFSLSLINKDLESNKLSLSLILPKSFEDKRERMLIDATQINAAALVTVRHFLEEINSIGYIAAQYELEQTSWKESIQVVIRFLNAAKEIFDLIKSEAVEEYAKSS